MGVSAEMANWESGKTKPVAAQFRPVVAFLGYDPTPQPPLERFLAMDERAAEELQRSPRRIR
jgi:hypothetical protein